MAAVCATGLGPEVVLVHGSLGDYRQWTPVAAILRDRFRVVAVSRRYHWPRTETPAEAAYTYLAQRDDLLQILRQRKEPVHLVGHSYGAGIVLLAALADPSPLRSLVLIEPAFGSLLAGDTPGLQEELTSRGAMLADVRASGAAGDAATASRRLIDWVQGGEGGFSRLPGWVQAALLDNAPTAAATVSHPPPQVTVEDLRDVRVPALVVAGEGTRPYYRWIARRAASAIAGARFAELGGASHMTIVERPQALATLLASFCDEVERTRKTT